MTPPRRRGAAAPLPPLALLALLALLTSRAAARASGAGVPDLPFPDRSTTPPLLGEDALHVAAELEYPPAQVAVDPRSRRVFFSFHTIYNPPRARIPHVAELVAGNRSWEPFPRDQSAFETVMGLAVAPRRGWLLALDHARMGALNPPKLHVVDLARGALLRSYEFPADVAGPGSMLMDLVVAPDERVAYVADAAIKSKRPSIIVVDLEEFRSARHLDDHPSTRAKNATLRVNGNKPPKLSLEVHVRTVALNGAGDTLYFGSLFDPYMWKVPTRSFRPWWFEQDRASAGADDDAQQQQQQQPQQHEGGAASPSRLAQIAVGKTMSTTARVDPASGLLYVCDVEHSAIWVANPERRGEYSTLVRSPSLLRWPDGLAVDGDTLWIAPSALDEFFGASEARGPPYHILRTRTAGAALPPRHKPRAALVPGEGARGAESGDASGACEPDASSSTSCAR